MLLFLVIIIFTLGNHGPDESLKIKKYIKMGMSNNPCSHDLANCHMQQSSVKALYQD